MGRITLANAVLGVLLACIGAQTIAAQENPAVDRAKRVLDRPLALSLTQKRSVIASCEQSLHALQQALAKRANVGTGRFS